MDEDTKTDIVAHIITNPQQSLAAMNEASTVLRTKIHQFLKKILISSA